MYIHIYIYILVICVYIYIYTCLYNNDNNNNNDNNDNNDNIVISSMIGPHLRLPHLHLVLRAGRLEHRDRQLY